MQAELDKPIEDTTAELRQRKQEITSQIEDCNRILNNRDIVNNAKDRIEELKQSERDLSNQKSLLEGQFNLITEFIKTKADTLTDIMNSKFKHVRFRLFDVQQNGGVVEVCDAMVNTNGKWVPYAGGNTADGLMRASIS
jgi:chromosome segregation ATPase